MKVNLLHEEHKEFLKLIDLINENKYFFKFIKWDENHWTKHNIYYQIKEVVNYGSGWNFFHYFIHLKNNHIISFHSANYCIEYSGKTWKNLDDYYNDNGEKEEGFGYEANNPNHDERIIENISLKDEDEEEA